MADRVRAIKLGFEKADVRDRRGFSHAVTLAYRNVSESGKSARKFWSEWRSAGLDPGNAMIARELARLGGQA